MPGDPLPGIAFGLDDAPLESETRWAALGAYQLGFITSFPLLGVQVDSSYLGSGEAVGSVHLVKSRTATEIVLPGPGDGPPVLDPSACLYDHLTTAFCLLEEATRGDAALELDDKRPFAELERRLAASA